MTSIDVVIPAYNEEAHVGPCLDHVLAQDYPEDCFRVWVVDAGSSDATVEVVSRYAESDPRVVPITGLGRLNAGQAMNAGIREASGQLIARVDAHTYLDTDYLTRAVEVLGECDDDVAEVGGQPRQQGETRFGRANALARQSRFGVGGSVYTDSREQAWVDTVQAGVYRRAALDDVGLFDESMLVGEDIELNWRLRAAGYRILLDRRIRFRYTTRGSWGAAFRQFRNYGQARVRTLEAHPDFMRPRHLAPSVLLATFATLVTLAPTSIRARRALLMLGSSYTAAVLVGATQAARRDEPALTGTIALCFTALHLGYGLGMIEGLGQRVAMRLGVGEPPTVVNRR